MLVALAGEARSLGRMRWSFRVGRVAGTEVRVHVTFFVLLAAFGWIFHVQGGPWAALEGVSLIVAVFGCVLLHEFGHVLTAKLFGVRTPDITLLPIGGMARLERMPEKPVQELLVALAGPAVNVVIAGVLAVFCLPFSAPESADRFLMQGTFLQRLMLINIGLVVFNLIPAFPMDGGRVLRSLLAMVMDYGRATNLAANIGQFLALMGGLIGLASFNPILILIAVFVFMAARGEAEMVQTRLALTGVPLGRAMMTDFRSLRREASLAEAAEALLAGPQHDFPVVDGGGELAGILTRSRLIEALAKQGRRASVGEVMLREVPTVPLHYPLREAFQILKASPLESLPVVEEGRRRVIGLLTAENIGELVLVRNAARELAVPEAGAWRSQPGQVRNSKLEY